MTPDDFTDDEVDHVINEAELIVRQVKPLLGGRDPGVQGAALVELLAMWIAGHPPQVRAAILATHVETVAKLVPNMELQMFGKRGHPNRHQQ